jgi:hypothetical protein
LIHPSARGDLGGKLHPASQKKLVFRVDETPVFVCASVFEGAKGGLAAGVPNMRFQKEAFRVHRITAFAGKRYFA